MDRPLWAREVAAVLPCVCFRPAIAGVVPPTVTRLLSSLGGRSVAGSATAVQQTQSAIGPSRRAGKGQASRRARQGTRIPRGCVSEMTDRPASEGLASGQMQIASAAT